MEGWGVDWTRGGEAGWDGMGEVVGGRFEEEAGGGTGRREEGLVIHL